MKKSVLLFVISLAWILITRTDLTAGQQSFYAGSAGNGVLTENTGFKNSSFFNSENAGKNRNVRNGHKLKKHRLTPQELKKILLRQSKMYSGNKSGTNDTIYEGYDFFLIPDASILIGGNELPVLPEDFFGPGSDPFTGTIDFAGYETNSELVPYYDVEIDRLENAILPPPYPSNDKITVGLMDLYLVSSQPVTVTYNNGQYSEEWNVEMYLSWETLKSEDSLSITKTDTTGGYYSYEQLTIQPYFYFTNGENYLEWNTSDSIPPILYSQLGNSAWKSSGNEAGFVMQNDTVYLLSSTGESFIEMVPSMLRDDEFSASADNSGNVTGNGTGFSAGQWYYYPESGLYMAWFPNFQLDSNKIAEYYVDFGIVSTSSPSYAEVYAGWATPEWSLNGVPDKPPLPQYFGNPSDENIFVKLFEPVLNKDLNGTKTVQMPNAPKGSTFLYKDYQITGYNPEWVCIAVKGVNFEINYGYTEHICFDPSKDDDTFDYGDAPAPYPTLATDAGAYHRIFYSEWDDPVMLGNVVDSEVDGQPDSQCLGDDNAGEDDEDGLVAIGNLNPGIQSDIELSFNTDYSYINAWLDFNADGDWDDEGEHIIIDEEVGDYQQTFEFLVPANAVLGETALRLRVSYLAGLPPTGYSIDGEVEDYQVTITELGNKWEQQPDSTIAGYEAHDYNNAYGDYRVLYVADDWQCEGGWVNSIEWWGTYGISQGTELRGAGTDHFKLQVLYHFPDNCTPANWVMYSADVPFDSVYEQPTGMTNALGAEIYHYVCHLHEPFIQHQGEKYWLALSAISNDPDNPAVWHWQESASLENPSLCGGIYREWPVFNWEPVIEGEWPELYPDFAFVINSIPPLPADFGDAPESYSVTLDYNAPVHIIDSVHYLGSAVDAEPDGIPDENALGDDNTGIDDEDGVTFLTPLITGNLATIEVTASAPGYLSVWADFQHVVSFEDEDIIQDKWLTAGVNTLSFNVPVNAVPGKTFFRFRFSTVQGLDFEGQAPDGEVEDYAAEVIQGDNKWLQEPMAYSRGIPAHDLTNESVYNGFILADDWICMGGNVTGVKWWGSYEPDQNGNEKRGAGINYFHLAILENDSVNPMPQNTELWSEDVPFANIQEVNTGFSSNDNTAVYRYSYTFQNPFPQIAGHHYWFAIIAYCNNPADPAVWRRQISAYESGIRLNDAVAKMLVEPEGWYVLHEDGNVVDLSFEILSDNYYTYDFGDAPQPYPTTIDNNGAVHAIDTTVYLGSYIDSEPDGQPSNYANGDNINGLNDEDGVIIPELHRGNSALFNVIASTSGYLNAWIDFNSDGVWQPDEQIFTDKLLSAGSNFLIDSIPEDALLGYTFARFRFSTQQGLSPGGFAADGEVEDYRVNIEEEASFKWQQQPDVSQDALHVNTKPANLLADAFECDITGPLTQISIYGGWHNNIIPNGNEDDVSFTLSIHDNYASANGNMPGTTLWTHTYQPGEFSHEYIIYEQNFNWQNPDGTDYEFSADMQCIRYDFSIPFGEFEQQGVDWNPKTYWLTVQAVPNSSDPDCMFGWNSAPYNKEPGSDNVAMWATGSEPYSGNWDTLFYAPGHPFSGEPVRLAFDITGAEDPYILLWVQARPEFFDSEYFGKSGNGIGDVIPLHQPFDENPNARWYYQGTEKIDQIPDPKFMLDWVLVEVRDASSAQSATDNTVIGRMACLVDKDGDIFNVNDERALKFYIEPQHDIYVAVWQRNHLGILSANPAHWNGGEYSFDFSGPDDVYGGTDALKNLAQGIWGMYGGDINGDGTIDNNDLQLWKDWAGKYGYFNADVNLNGEVDNMDKNDVIIENEGKSCLIPQ